MAEGTVASTLYPAVENGFVKFSAAAAVQFCVL